MDIISPVNNQVYNTKKIDFIINLTEPAKSLLYSIKCGTFKTLCTNCDSYGILPKKSKSFSEGKHSILFKAVFNPEGTIEDGGIYQETVSFIIDTRAPRITTTLPKKGFADGYFEVQFKEDNPKEVWLNYGNEETGFRQEKVNLKDCFDPDRKEHCVMKVNLSDYTEQDITYWFNITDILNRVDQSKPIHLKVDISKPVINSFDYTINKRKVTFNLDISEENFDKVSYIDYTNKKPKLKILCSSLRGNKCIKAKTFSKGSHKIDLQVLDEAENLAEIKNIEFEI